MELLCKPSLDRESGTFTGSGGPAPSSHHMRGTGTRAVEQRSWITKSSTWQPIRNEALSKGCSEEVVISKSRLGKDWGNAGIQGGEYPTVRGVEQIDRVWDPGVITGRNSQDTGSVECRSSKDCPGQTGLPHRGAGRRIRLLNRPFVHGAADGGEVSAVL